MRIRRLILPFLILMFGLSQFGCIQVRLARDPQADLTQSPLFLEKVRVNELEHAQRMGYLLESRESNFKGCVIYLEGFADSIMNHAPLFNKLTNAGYRVLMFDYLGQGGSEGEMAKTRIAAKGAPYPKAKDYEIGEQARFVWKRYSESKDPVYGRDCAESPKLVIGWSTGGLAAYKLAREKWGDAFVFIAPGIVPYKCVGESSGNCLSNLTENEVVTVRTLTRNTFAGTHDPHLDPVRPTSIVKEAKEFATNLLTTAALSRSWKIPKATRGLVFLSGVEDTYVDREKTQKILKTQAPSFEIVSYDGALHEIDNELPEVAEDMHRRTVEFFDSVIAGK